MDEGDELLEELEQLNLCDVQRAPDELLDRIFAYEMKVWSGARPAPVHPIKTHEWVLKIQAHLMGRPDLLEAGIEALAV